MKTKSKNTSNYINKCGEEKMNSIYMNVSATKKCTKKLLKILEMAR